MSFNKAKQLTLLLGALILAGCGVLKPNLSEMAGEYDRQVEESQKSNLLMNIVRSAFNQPLYFTTIPTVRGSGSVSPTLATSLSATSASSALVTLTGSTINPTLTLSASEGFNFDLNSFDNAEFFARNLAPIEARVLQHYLDQNVPPEVVANLFVGKIAVIRDGVTTELSNDPMLKSYPDFLRELEILLKAGLRTQSVTRESTLGPVLSAEDAGKLILSGSPLANSLKQLSSVGDKYVISKSTTSSNFCLANLSSGSNVENTCEVGEQKKDEDFDPMKIAKTRYVVTLRSTRAMFKYLGRLLEEQLDEEGRPRASDPGSAKRPTRSTPLLVVTTSTLRPSSRDLTMHVAQVQYRGRTWTIPSTDNGHSSLVFGILHEVLALNKVPGSIPAPTISVLR